MRGVDRRPGEATRLLEAIGRGDRRATDDLLVLLYDELHLLAERRLARERGGALPHPTSLVHEAYLRLVGGSGGAVAESADGAAGPPGTVRWDHDGHFFAAAAEAMRRILVERARRRASAKHGGGRIRVRLTSLSDEPGEERDPVDLVALDDALARLARMDHRMTEIVKLRFFAGLTIAQTALALGVADRTVERDWLRARAWLLNELESAIGERDDVDGSGGGDALPGRGTSA